MALWGSGVRLPSAPPNSSSRTVAPVLNSQDIQIIRDIWDHDLSLVQVWSCYKLLHVNDSCTYEEALKAFLEDLAHRNKTKRYIDEMRYVLARLQHYLPGHLKLPEITTKTMWSALESAGMGETGRRKAAVFLNWAYHQRMMPVPIKVHGKPSYPRGEIQTLSNRDVASLIRVCPEDLLGHLWLCLCMGLRVAEAVRSEDLIMRDGHLIVGAKAAKTKTRRVIQWLPGHDRFASQVTPQVNLRRRMTALKSQAAIKHWPRNAMRHTAASHWLNHYQDEAKAALHLGHSPTMLHRHYKALVTRKESEEFFKLWD